MRPISRRHWTDFPILAAFAVGALCGVFATLLKTRTYTAQKSSQTKRNIETLVEVMDKAYRDE